MENLAQEVVKAEKRIRDSVRKTYLERSDYLSEQTGANVYLKMECMQYTGAFKLRGAMNKMLTLTAEQRAKGVITASTGNHGFAVCHGANVLDMKAVVFVPETVPEFKKRKMQQMGAVVMVSGRDNCQAQAAAREYAAKHDLVFVAPYNDPMVVAGQGTIGFEIAEQIDHVDVVMVCLGGGGFTSGVGGYLKSVWPNIDVIACSPENSCGMITSIRAGKIVEIVKKETLSDGSAGGSIVPGSITFDLCRKYVDHFETLNEDEIRDALRTFIATHHLLIEGAAAVPIAALLRSGRKYEGKTVVIVLCGSNISTEMLRSVL